MTRSHYQFNTKIGVIAAFLCTLAVPVLNAKAQDRYSVEDAWLEGRLATLLALDPNMNGFGLNAKVLRGKAALTGTVHSEFEKELAGDMAISISGIDSLENNIRVNEPKEPLSAEVLAETQDSAITAAISTKYLLNTLLDSSKIEVDTVDNYVQLKGEVTTEIQRQIAEDIARETYGEDQLQNFLLVTEP